MKIPIEKTSINIPVMGLTLAMVLCGTVYGKANNKPKIAKGNVIESSVKQAEWSAKSEPNQSGENSGFAAESQKIASVIENWMVDSTFWSCEEASGSQLNQSTEGKEQTTLGSETQRISGSEKSAVYFDVNQFISDSEF